MRILFFTMAGLVALGGLVALAGALMPRDHVARSSVILPVDADSVWHAIRALGALPAWWPEVQQMTLDSTRTDESWLMENGFGVMRLTVTGESPRRTLMTRLEDTRGGSFGGEWTYEIEATADGSRLTVTERGWIGNPVFRVLLRLGGPHRTIDGYLRALARRFGGTEAARHEAAA